MGDTEKDEGFDSEWGLEEAIFVVEYLLALVSGRVHSENFFLGFEET